MNKMYSIKVFQIMRYLRENLIELNFDTIDLEERGVSDILRELQIYTVLTDSEVCMLYKELYKILRQSEISEAVRLAECQ